jgi:hypothetical protein
MLPHRDNFQHWYERATEARKMADTIDDPAAREEMRVRARIVPEW